MAKKILVKNHYLHSFPGCTELCFGAFSATRLLGAITFGAGPTNAYRLIEGVKPDDCLTQGHIGIIYQAGGWLYTGLSEAMPKFDLGDGIARHSRSLSHAFGSHSLRYFSECGLDVKVLPQLPKHRYIYLLRQDLMIKVNAPILPYPKKENEGRVRGYGSNNNNDFSLIPFSNCTGRAR